MLLCKCKCSCECGATTLLLLSHSSSTRTTSTEFLITAGYSYLQPCIHTADGSCTSAVLRMSEVPNHGQIFSATTNKKKKIAESRRTLQRFWHAPACFVMATSTHGSRRESADSSSAFKHNERTFSCTINHKSYPEHTACALTMHQEVEAFQSNPLQRDHRQKRTCTARLHYAVTATDWLLCPKDTCCGRYPRPGMKYICFRVSAYRVFFFDRWCFGRTQPLTAYRNRSAWGN